MYKFIDLDTGLPALLNKVKTWVTSKLSAKQGTISDLDTIRSGAAAGATAVQDNSYVHTDNNYTSTEKTKLAGLPTGTDVYTKSEVDTKVADAGKVKSVSVNNGTPSQPDAQGNVNVSVPTLTLDDAPTAGSNNAVKSGGIKTALDAKANAADVPTNQDMADAIDDALGEAQVTVVPAGSIGVISSLGSDSDEDALAASMGKKLKVAVLTILNSLGNYAFPDGKPVIDWGDDTPVIYTVQKTIGTGLSATGGDTDVNDGDPLEVSIAITDNLYIVDDDSVVVTMGGQPVAGAWNASTMKVTIAAVTGNVAINVPSLTYVSSGLVSMFDGMNRGGTAGSWQDLANTSRSVAFTGGVTENSDNLQLDGTAIGIGDFADNVSYDGLTWECVIEQASKTSPNKQQTMFFIGKTGAATISVTETTFSGATGYMWLTHARPSTASMTVSTPVFWFNSNVNTKYSISHYGTKMIQNGASINSPGNGMMSNPYKTDYDNKTVVGGKWNADGTVNYGFNGKIYAIRVYSRVLSDAEALHNWKIDKKRFNIS